MSREQILLLVLFACALLLGWLAVYDAQQRMAPDGALADAPSEAGDDESDEEALERLLDELAAAEADVDELERLVAECMGRLQAELMAAVKGTGSRSDAESATESTGRDSERGRA